MGALYHQRAELPPDRADRLMVGTKPTEDVVAGAFRVEEQHAHRKVVS